MRKLLLGAAALLLVAAPAFATPATYHFTGGQVTATFWISGVPMTNTLTLQMDGDFVVFDGMIPAITDFSLSISGTGIALSPAINGYDTLDLDVSIVPGAGYVSNGSGTNPTVLTNGPIDVVGSYTVTGPGLPPVSASGAPLFSTSNLPITLWGGLPGAMAIEIGGATLFEFTAPGGARVELIADIFWRGEVPEPGIAGLVVLGLLGAMARGSLGRGAR